MLLKAIALAAALLLLAAPAAAQPYGNCPTQDADRVCEVYHGDGALATAYCTYERCFDVNDGTAIRVVAGDDEGPFPRTWFVWSESVVTPAGLPCAVRQQGKKKFRIDIPEPAVRCAAKLQFGGYTYGQHFASNPSSGCLAWLECRLPTAP